MDYLERLQRVLDTGDLELRFHDGRSIKAHSLKLKLASFDGVLKNLIEDVVDDQITGNKRKRSDSDNIADPPSLAVRGHDPCDHAAGVFTCMGCLSNMDMMLASFLYILVPLYRMFTSPMLCLYMFTSPMLCSVCSPAMNMHRYKNISDNSFR